MKWKNILLKILSGALLVPVAGFLFIFLNYHLISLIGSDIIYRKAENLPYHKYTLVLGSGSTNPGVWENHSFEHRMQAVRDLYFLKKTEKVIVSGISNKKFYNEPFDMKRKLLDYGLPFLAVYPDHGGIRTWVSVERSKNYYKASSLIIVSQEEQLERALFCAGCMGIDAIGFAAEPIPYRHRYWVLREYFARVKSTMDCFVYRLKNP
jgi:SanA protein